MSSKLKQHIVRKVFDAVKGRSRLVNHFQLTSQVSVGNLKHNKGLEWQLNLPLCFDTESDREIESVQLSVSNLDVDDKISEIELRSFNSYKQTLCFSVDNQTFVKDILDSDPIQLNYLPKKDTVIVEFSSPNIAKPFHAGHLRSTIIGNYISNLKQKLNKNVLRINYLGDWGTQFGLLKFGVDISNYSEDMLQRDPINLLYHAYVKANKEAELNPEILLKAREIFKKLENGDSEYLEDWVKYRQYTIEELKILYNRLGINFDEYSWESSYEKKEIESVLEALISQGIIIEGSDNSKVTKINEKVIPLVKSDGSTLYLMRDIAAALDRKTRYNFNEMYYVVENSQFDHFNALFSTCKKMHLENYWKMKHVKFGRIHGMSTRRGNVIFLKDILEEAKNIMYQKQLNTPTTKVEVTDETADILGVSAVIVNDLKQRRQKDYEFNWEKAVQTNGDSGIRLQYAHCRLYSLLQNSGATLPKECDPEVLKEPEALILVQEIARFEEILLRSNVELEASIIVSYLFRLCNAANKAFKVLPIKGQDVHIGSQRLLLFNTCRKILAEGMRIIGLKPLNQM